MFYITSLTTNQRISIWLLIKNITFNTTIHWSGKTRTVFLATLMQNVGADNTEAWAELYLFIVKKRGKNEDEKICPLPMRESCHNENKSLGLRAPHATSTLRAHTSILV